MILLSINKRIHSANEFFELQHLILLHIIQISMKRNESRKERLNGRPVFALSTLHRVNTPRRAVPADKRVQGHISSFHADIEHMWREKTSHVVCHNVTRRPTSVYQGRNYGRKLAMKITISALESPSERICMKRSTVKEDIICFLLVPREIKPARKISGRRGTWTCRMAWNQREFCLYFLQYVADSTLNPEWIQPLFSAVCLRLPDMPFRPFWVG